MAATLHLVAIATAAFLTVSTAKTVHGETARLTFDFAAATLEVVTQDDSRRFALEEGLGPRLSLFRIALARGEWSPELAASLGKGLLGPARGTLEVTDQWEVSPLEAAPLAALIAPWDTARPLLHGVVVWYRPAGMEARHRPPPGPPPEREPGEGVLAIAPFLPGPDPQADAADTLLAAFRSGSKTLDLIPRNDTTPASVAGVLVEHRYSVVWLRADRDRARSLLAPLSAGPQLLWWSRPWSEAAYSGTTADDAFEPVTDWTAGGKSILVDLWPRRERAAAAGARVWMDAIARGEEVASAVAAARRALALAPGATVQDWAGWIMVGDGGATLSWSRPNWLQRWLRR